MINKVDKCNNKNRAIIYLKKLKHLKVLGLNLTNKTFDIANQLFKNLKKLKKLSLSVG